MKKLVKVSFTYKEEKALKEIKEFLSQNFNGGEIFVYGSKIYGEHTQGSDLDLLIIIPDLNWKMKKKIINKITEINWKLDTNISPVVVSKEEWTKYLLIPLFQEVREKGLII